jgi:hypothetical protein
VDTAIAVKEIVRTTRAWGWNPCVGEPPLHPVLTHPLVSIDSLEGDHFSSISYFGFAMKHVLLPLWAARTQPLAPIRTWLDHLTVRDPHTASFLTRIIPAQCPFARTIRLGNYTLLQIPPLCKLNPLYDELMSLRFRALCYLAEAGYSID